MLYYNFSNYEEFKAVFGMNYHNNGTKSRRNKILLSFIKNKNQLHNAVETNNFSLLHISSMAELKNTVIERIQDSAAMDPELTYQMHLKGQLWWSSKYSTDSANGLCEDGDIKAIRYQNMETGKIFKMKAGKMMRSLILDTKFGREQLPEQVQVWLAEEFASDWEAYTFGKIPKNQLVVDQNFEKIYNQDACEGNFGSCMVDKNLHSFYSDAVDASAAYLVNEEGMIIARSVIFNKVYDEDGKIWRLCERQYSTDGSETLKRALVLALIKENRIDGYKQIGVDCHSSRSFVDLEGNSLQDKEFHIDCELGLEDTLSYQDSFKWYDYGNKVAYNYEPDCYDYCLDTTDGAIEPEDEDEYDEYHDRYVQSTTCVYYHGRELYCDSEDLDDFHYIDGEYYHEDDCTCCDECGEYVLNADAYHSDLTGKDYCCDSCREDAEHDYKVANWHYADWDDDYFPSATDITTYNKFDAESGLYETQTISKKSLQDLVDRGFMFHYGLEFYDTINYESNLPYGYSLTKIA